MNQQPSCYLRIQAHDTYPDGLSVVKDRSSCHQAAICKQQRAEYNIQMQEHPPALPDLNLIENIWYVFKNLLGSKKALGSYGRSIGVRDQADPQRSRPWPMDEEMLEKAWSECNLHGECSLHGDHGHGGPGRMHGDPSTATRRTELKEHTDGYHSGAREAGVKGTVTGQRRRSSV
ncbi:uncharacterized protein UHOD_11216 [Ustilago sp. UG-2017b]|nr:uncharacterized protein UHOD_11216 [Ustilago sp. UG-2017b]